MPRRTWLCFCAGILLSAGWIAAQDTRVKLPPQPYTGTSDSISIFNIPRIANAPFTAIALIEHAQTLPNGIALTERAKTTIARDSQGRTHNESHYYSNSQSGDGPTRDITIIDPNKGVETILNPATMRAKTSVLPVEMTTPVRGPVFTEDLGLSSIDGLSVHGFRKSRTIPASAAFDGPPATITDEYWYSDELQMDIRSKHSDPWNGTVVTILTRVSRDEPDSKMFEVPTSYKLVASDADTQVMKISAAVADANLIRKVDAVYPPIAKSAGVQGTVAFSVTVGEDGTIKSMQLVSGHPLLVMAARAAVLQYKYRPTLLNGVPVSVIAPVNVKFALGN